MERLCCEYKIVRLEGFEPPTPGSEDQCSNPLSYRRLQRKESYQIAKRFSHDAVRACEGSWVSLFRGRNADLLTEKNVDAAQGAFRVEAMVSGARYQMPQFRSQLGFRQGLRRVRSRRSQG